MPPRLPQAGEGSGQFPYGSRSRGPFKPGRECKFCKNNGESPDSYRSHVLRNPGTGQLICPVLRDHKCEFCGATGDDAHTKSYCPQAKREAKKSLPTMLKVGQHTLYFNTRLNRRKRIQRVWGNSSWSNPNRVLGDKKAIRRNFAKRRKAVLILATDCFHPKILQMLKYVLWIFPIYLSFMESTQTGLFQDRMLFGYSNVFHFTKISSL